MLGDEAAEVVALQGQPDDALHRVPQRRQWIGAWGERGLRRRLAAVVVVAGVVLSQGVHAQLQVALWSKLGTLQSKLHFKTVLSLYYDGQPIPCSNIPARHLNA